MSMKLGGPEFYFSMGSACIGGPGGQSVINHQGKYETSNSGRFFLILLFSFSLNPIFSATASGSNTPNAQISAFNGDLFIQGNE